MKSKIIKTTSFIIVLVLFVFGFSHYNETNKKLDMLFLRDSEEYYFSKIIDLIVKENKIPSHLEINQFMDSLNVSFHPDLFVDPFSRTNCNFKYIVLLDSVNAKPVGFALISSGYDGDINYTKNSIMYNKKIIKSLRIYNHEAWLFDDNHLKFIKSKESRNLIRNFFSYMYYEIFGNSDYLLFVFDLKSSALKASKMMTTVVDCDDIKNNLQGNYRVLGGKFYTNVQPYLLTNCDIEFESKGSGSIIHDEWKYRINFINIYSNLELNSNDTIYSFLWNIDTTKKIVSFNAGIILNK